MDPSITRLREAAPYINAHRGRTFVIWLSGSAFDDPNLERLLQDLGLLISLGMRLIMVFGAAGQVQQRLDDLGIESVQIDGERVTGPEALAAVQEVVGRLRSRLEASLSQSIVDGPARSGSLGVVSGNFIKARPAGILQGVDFQYSGRIRRIDVPGLQQHLENGNLVLIPPLGYSVTGEVFNLQSPQLAAELAIQTGAGKLLFLRNSEGILVAGKLCSELKLDEVEQLLQEETLSAEEKNLLELAKMACERGVDRCHFVSCAEDGALLQELFTREGAGTQLSQLEPEQLRAAALEDIPGIIKLIKPLEEKGVLARRSRERLEMEIGNFTVIDKDGLVIASAALHPFGDFAELACLAIHEAYRNADLGDRLLKHLEQKARQKGFASTFVLTTQSADWFRERGYVQTDISALPAERKDQYNFQRNSRAYIKQL